MKARVNNTEEFITEFKKIFSNEYDLSQAVFVNMKTPVTVICQKHGEITKTPTQFLNGYCCTACSKEKLSERYRDNINDLIKQCKEVHGDKYDYSLVYNNYVNKHKNVSIICKKHGIFEQSLHSHINGQGCKECYLEGKKIGNTEKLKEKIDYWNKIHNFKFDYSLVTEYHNNRELLPIICHAKDKNGIEHGIMLQTAYQHENGYGCKKCACEATHEKTKMTFDQFLLKARTIHGWKYEYIKESFIDYNTPVKIVCQKHGEFEQMPHDHLDGCGCKKCGYYIEKSKTENEIYNFIKEYFDDVIESDRNIINPYELDIYIPSKKIGIEYNGLYWHSDAVGKDKNYHLNKLNLCKEKGIFLIQIFEDEYVYHKNIALNKLKHILGVQQDLPKIMGRKCIITEINNKQANEFLTTYHIQGFVPSTVYLGAFYNDELVAVMTFKREDKNGLKWDLNRFASNYNYVFQGVGGKLFKYFIRSYNPEEIKSFADRRWTINEENNVYLQLDFKFDKYIKPDYKYFLSGSNKLIHKFNFRKKRLSKIYNLPITMSEEEMRKKINAYKVYDCGLIKYIWEKQKEETI